ncbi:MAG: site-2 protease family protein [Patescibacteria group bacterium]|jgi:Zn-dependent protease
MPFAEALLSIAAFLIALSVHEFCHALAGYLMGDGTAKRLGRLTLNPLAHLDPIGTVLVPLIGLLSGFPVIGWAKPVPFNPYNLRFHRWGATLVAMAGPASNFVSGLIFLFLLKFVLVVLALPLSNLLVMLLTQLVIVNAVLGVFNLIPVPPLDGAALMEALLAAPKYHNILRFLETRGPTILFILIILDWLSPVSIIGSVFTAIIRGYFSLAGL